MASVPGLDDGCAKILGSLLRFLGGPSLCRRAVVKAVVSLIVIRSTACIASVTVERLAGLVFVYLHLAGPASASSVYPGQFVGLFFMLVSAWILVFAVLLAAFVFLGAR